MSRSVVFWRRLDVAGLERLELTRGADGITAAGTVISLEAGGLRLDHRWLLGPDWRARSVAIRCDGRDGARSLLLERAGPGWLVDGARRPDLDGAEEPDLSVTPFCNTLPLRRVPDTAGSTLTLDTAWISGVDLSVARSRQRYLRIAPGRLRYIDLGLFEGFRAELEVDAEGLVLRYEGLFEQVAPAG